MQLTIGVTGHRDLVAEEIPALKEIVRGFFLQLRKDFPELDLQLITPLAEGSDRLVTDIALNLGIDLVVPLPMPQDEYEQDFTSPAAVEVFRETLTKARVIHLQTLSEVDGRTVTAADHERQYAQLGIFISNHSQVLLALWDGKTSTTVGGTAGVVNYHLTAVMPGFSVAEESPNLLADNENDLAYHVVCSRDRPNGQPAQGFQPLQTAWVTAHFGRETADYMPLEYEVMLHRLQDFGQDQARYQAEIKNKSVDLLKCAPELEYPSGIDVISSQHGVADWLAIHFQKRVFSGLVTTHSIAVLIGLVFILYSEFDGLDFLLTVFLLAFLAGFVLFKKPGDSNVLPIWAGWRCGPAC